MNGKRQARKPQRRTPRTPRAAAKRPDAKDALVVAATAVSTRAGVDPEVVDLLARRALLVAARGLLREHVDRCTKCGSSFVTHEPAFVHCHYCGRMHRIANASLMDQEVFEIRMGLRLAS